MDYMRDVNSERLNCMEDQVRFISIIPLFPNKSEYLADMIMERYRKSGIREYALSLTLQPQGEDVWKKIRIQAQAFQELQTLLKKHPVKLGILLQATLGHGGYWNMVPDTSFQGQRIIDKEGRETPRFCPYDPAFRKYIRQAVSEVVAAHPDFILCDDDMRMFDGTCFCPYHIKKISALSGREYDLETLAAELEKAPPHSRIAQIFEEVQIDAMQQLARIIREATDEVDPAIPGGCCIVSVRADYAEPLARILAGRGHRPLVRVNNGAYLEGPVRFMSWSRKKTAFQVVNLKKKGIQLLDESDTCPHNRFSKTARTMHLHIVTGLVMGLDGGKLWFDQGVWPLRDVSYQYEEIVGRFQGFYNSIHYMAKSWQPLGVMTQIPEFSKTPYPYNGVDFLNYEDWGAAFFGQMGIASFYGDAESQGIRSLAGHQVDYFSDQEIRKMLSGPMIIDGEAAVLLTQRGFSEMLGVRAENRPTRGNKEWLKDLQIKVPFSAIDKTPFLTALPETEELSQVSLELFKGDTEQIIMPGCLYYCNSAGGRVVTMALTLSSWHRMMIENPGRRRQMIYLVDKLRGYPVHLAAEQYADLFAARLPDGAEVLVISNYSYDPLPIILEAVLPPRKVQNLQSIGTFTDIPYRFADGRLEVEVMLEPAEVAVLKLVY